MNCLTSSRYRLAKLFALVALVGLTVIVHSAYSRLEYSEVLLRQYMRGNTPLQSTHYTRQPENTGYSAKRVLFYTPIGCTFDPRACSYLAGCSRALKVCDQSHKLDACDVTLNGTYSYSTLSQKNHEFITHMCNHPGEFAGAYDVLVKVDDDVLYNPNQMIDALSRISLDERAVLGFIRMTKHGVVWPSGAVYAYTSGVLRELCKIPRALRTLRGEFEDVRFGRAVSILNKTHAVEYYNADNIFNFVHLQYRSSRMFLQFMQYGKCLS